MRQMLWVLCGLVVAVSARAQEKDPCKRSRELVLQEATKYACPEEEAEAKAITCQGTGMAAVKEARRLSELVRLCHQKPRKGAAASAKETGPTEKKETAAAADPGELPAGQHKCRGVDPGGNVIASNGSDKGSVDCLSELKAKVAAKLCDGSKPDVEFTYQTHSRDKWTKGIPVKARCKK